MAFRFQESSIQGFFVHWNRYHPAQSITLRKLTPTGFTVCGCQIIRLG